MKTLIYIPTIYRDQKGSWPPTTPSCWYYSWQKYLYNYLSKQSYNVIWKAGPRTSNLIDPIKYFKSKNIRYSEKKLSRELKKVDFALVDTLSTPTMECLIKNIPCLCLLFFDYDFLIDDDYGDFKGIFRINKIEDRNFILAYNKIEEFYQEIYGK